MNNNKDFTVKAWRYELPGKNQGKARIGFFFTLDSIPGTLISVRLYGTNGILTGLREKVAQDGTLSISFKASLVASGHNELELQGDTNYRERLSFEL